MTLKLYRSLYEADGVFGYLTGDNNELIACTLEHAYDSGEGNGSFKPKLINGTYKCVRGQHKLHGMDHTFETFEITGVPGHSGILFHVGNLNKDSEGCVLLGDTQTRVKSVTSISHSRITFEKFMDLQKNVNEFTLIVT